MPTTDKQPRRAPGGLVEALFGSLFARRPSRDAHAQDRRALGRYPVNLPVTLVWRDANGVQQRRKGRLLEMSEYGASIRIAASLTAGTIVFLSSARLQTNGAARVRRCSKKGFSFVLGLQFHGTLARSIAA